MSREGVCATCGEECSVDAAHCEECRIEEIDEARTPYGYDSDR